jgi:hypothetical protein
VGEGFDHPVGVAVSVGLAIEVASVEGAVDWTVVRPALSGVGAQAWARPVFMAVVSAPMAMNTPAPTAHAVAFAP